jgi:hypothetical protein
VARPNGHDTEDSDAESGPVTEAGACLACRGTGRLISGLGGTPHEVVCPWCRGTGVRIPGINAQESPAETAPPAGTDPAPPAGAE